MRNILAVGLLATTMLVSQLSSAQPLVDISADPLYTKFDTAKPSLVLDLSIEFPTVGTQYRGDFQPRKWSPNGYIPSEYIGYFNHELCYAYNDAPNPDERYFYPVKRASANLDCPGGEFFSGNMMNAVTTSAVDILRYGLSGGDRFIDTREKTVLQRAVLPADKPFGDLALASMYGYDMSLYVPNALLKTLDGKTGTDIANVYAFNCLDRVYFRDGNTTFKECADFTGEAKQNAFLGADLATHDKIFFYVRVEVCTKDADGNLFDQRTVGDDGHFLCEKYPSGYYKPTGRLQAYADKMRVAAFSYPMINSDSVYAGILRAPMKHLGPNAYNTDFSYAGDNPRKEWDTQTGVFIKDPEGTGAQYSSGYSGVINYLNRFGRTGVPGTYKTYDHVNELYYESLRYLQGMKPTPESIALLTAGATADGDPYDGFPAYSTWEDPHPVNPEIGEDGSYSCYPNHILVIGDKNTHTDNRVPGYNRLAYGEEHNTPNFKTWTDIIGKFEAGQDVTYVDGDGITRHTTGNPRPNLSMSDMSNLKTGNNSLSNYSLVGMAYWARTHDIRSEGWTSQAEALKTDGLSPVRRGMRVKSYFIDVNERGDSNYLSQRLSNNQYHYAAKYGGFDNELSLGGNPFTTNGAVFNDALWMRGTEVESFPKTYYLSSDANAVLNAINDIFSTIVSSSHSITGVALSSGSATEAEAGDMTYQGTFETGTWTGDIAASVISIDPVTRNVLISKIPNWSPALQLELNGWQNRKILVGSRSGSAYQAKRFTWENLTSEQQGMILKGADSSYADVTGTDVVNFLRGDKSKSNVFRSRNKMMGDINHSSIIYKGAPLSKAYGLEYRAFYTEHASRAPILYVGANDGMLHAFDAETGNEKFAYIPSFVVNNLYKLAQPVYEHTSYVDATPAVEEVKIEVLRNNQNSVGGSSGVGVGETGSSANVGNSNSEFSWRTVLVGGAGGGGQGVYALDVTNPDAFDENSLLWEFTDKDDPYLGNVVGQPKIVRIQINEIDAIYEKWYAIVAGGVNNTKDDGFAAPSGASPHLFILDLSKPKGVAWELGVNYYKVPLAAYEDRPVGILDFSVVNKNNNLQEIYVGDLSGQVWKLSFKGLNANRAYWDKHLVVKRLFVTPENQSITMSPIVATDDTQTYVAFGTGKYLEDSDNEAPYYAQSLYVVLDEGENYNKSKLMQGTQNQTTKKVETPIFVWGSDTGGTTKAGWYFDLANSVATGERMVYNMTLRNGRLVVTTIIPPLGGCDIGKSNQFILNLKSGNGFYVKKPYVSGPSFWVIDNDVAYDPDTGEVRKGGESTSVDVTADGVQTDNSLRLPNSGIKGLISQRELTNYGSVKR